MSKPIMRLALFKAGGLAALVVLILLLEQSIPYVSNEYYTSAVAFLRGNLLLIIVMAALFMNADIFDSLRFPLNVPAPLISAIAAMFVVKLIYNAFDWIGTLTDAEIATILDPLSKAVYPLVFIIVLVLGYFGLFIEGGVVAKMRAGKQ